MKRVDLSLIIACYNEEKILAESIEHIERVFKHMTFSYEIIFVDDKSSDKTRQVIKKLIKGKKNFFAIFHNKNRGRGQTVTDGIKKARGTVVGFIDIDLEVSPVYIPSFVARVLAGSDVVCGHRIYRENLASLHRAILSRSYSYLVRQFLNVPFQDTETGYKFFDHHKILPILKKVRDPHWFWDTEIVTLAHYHGLHVEEIPVLFTRRFDKQSSVRLVDDTLDYLRNLLHFRRRLHHEFWADTSAIQ